MLNTGESHTHQFQVTCVREQVRHVSRRGCRGRGVAILARAGRQRGQSGRKEARRLCHSPEK